MAQIYIIDPQPVTRAGLIAILGEDADTSITGVSHSADHAPTEIRNYKPDLILLDLPRLGPTGVRLIDAVIREMPETKLVLLSDMESDEDLRLALDKGVHGFVVKGCEANMLRRALHAVAVGATWIDASIAKRVFDLTRVADHAVASAQERFNSTTCQTPPTNQVALRQQSNQLSQRELEVLRLLARGLNNRQIGSELFVSVDTIKTHVRHIFEKLDAKTRTDAVIKAIKAGLCETDLTLAS